MVLTRRSGALCVVLLAGCSESLFGAHRGIQVDDGGGSDSGDPPGTCTGSCIADAAADFDGMPSGAGNHWRYLEDLRNRTWSAMTGDLTGMTGMDSRNRITTCATQPSSPACSMLPNALLVSAAGTDGVADPAIEFTAPSAQVIKLSLHVFVPSGDDQTIRLYRNSREDVLFTGTATAGIRLDPEVTLDALPNDRFLVAVVPTGTTGATEVGLDLSASATGTHFPSTCQLALRFDSATGNTTSDPLCHQSSALSLFGDFKSTGQQQPLVFAAGPLLQGSSVKIPSGTYLQDITPGDLLNYTQDTTVQLWVNQGMASATTAWLFSDFNGTSGGGLGISILPGAPMLDVKTGDGSAPGFVHGSVAYPNPNTWHFVRVVHASAHVRVCVDGGHVLTIDATAPALAKGAAPNLGRDGQDTMTLPVFNGSLADLRVITGALPCDPPP